MLYFKFWLIHLTKLVSLLVIVIISYLSGIINLSILAERFVRWILRNRSYVSLLFGFATFSILINTIFTVVFVIGVLSTQPNEIERAYRTPASHYFPISIILYAPLYSISFIISYLVTWFATVTVLYSHLTTRKSKILGLSTFTITIHCGRIPPSYLTRLAQYRSSDPVTFTIILYINF